MALSNSTALQLVLNTSKCYGVSIKNADSPPTVVIAALAYNISMTTYPKFTQLFSETFTTPSYNVTDFFDIISTTETYNFSSLNYNNTNVTNEISIYFDDFTNSLMDYLSYILLPFLDANSTYINSTFIDSPNINETFPTETYELFKATILPITNITTDFIDERFDNELTTIYEEISSTIGTFKENATDFQNSTVCEDVPSNITTTITPLLETSMNYTARARLRSLCWETMFGQELIKLTVMDLIMTVLSTLSIDFFRGIFVRVMNRCWCWDLEKKFPQYGDFKVAENILHLVNNQGMVWMGMFFSPGLVVINIVKLYLMMYFRAWAVLTCNVPHEIIFRASRSNNFYYALLLMMLFLCVLPVGYAIVWVKPSWHCGPFSSYNRIFHIFTQTIKNTVPQPVQTALDYIASPGIVIPLLVLLVLVIYYLISLTGALREANNDLKVKILMIIAKK